MTHVLVPQEPTDLGNAFRDELAASVLVALAQANIPTDVQELLVYGDPMHAIPPGALSKACAVVWHASLDKAPKPQPDNAVKMVKHMVDRFLGWRLPKPWHPDNGISYQRPNYAHAPADHDWPTGTNLFDADQATEMVRYMLEGLPLASAPKPEPDDADELEQLKAEVERLRAALRPSPSPFSVPFSVCYRGDWTEEAYDEAIEALGAAKQQLLSEARGEYQPGCAVCSDSGHTASSCHHNPLILARRWAMATHIHTCCHCGFIATTEDEDREHFGKSEDEVAACLTKRADDAVKALVEAAKAALDEGLVYWEPNTRKGRINREHIVSALRTALRPFLKEGE